MSSRPRVSSYFEETSKEGKSSNAGLKGEFKVSHNDKPQKNKRDFNRLSISDISSTIYQYRDSKTSPGPFGVRHGYDEPIKLHHLNPVVPFNEAVANDVILDEVKLILPNTVFDKSLCVSLANKIHEKMESLIFSRYKYIVTVTLVDRLNQGIRIASRCLWDKECDNYISLSYDIGEKRLIVIVYATYFA